MTTRGWFVVMVVLGVIIVALAMILIFVPTPTTPISLEPVAATSTPATSTEPLSTRVTITSPSSGETVGHDMDVTGSAPGQWYFEASFPIVVRDENGAIIGNTPAQAQSDWMTEGLVAFLAHVHIDDAYHGAATLILLKDNPSGLPERDDSVSIPIVVQ